MLRKFKTIVILEGSVEENDISQRAMEEGSEENDIISGFAEFKEKEAL